MQNNQNIELSQEDLQALEALVEMAGTELDAGVGQAQFC
jgi:hypothetical protein